MSIGLLLLHLGLVLTAFLVMLNGHLRGAAKSAIDAALSLFWVSLLVAALVRFNWQAALAALALSFVYAAVTRPVARALARRLIGYRTTLSSGADTQMDYSVEGMFGRSEETDRRLIAIAEGPGVAKVLAENGLSPDDLNDQFWFLMAAGLGDLSWEIVASPTELQRLLQLRNQGVPAPEIALQLMR